MFTDINQFIIENGGEIAEGEEFKRCVGYPDYYVSNIGRVYSTLRNKFLKPSIDGSPTEEGRTGYYFLRLKKEKGIYDYRYIHRLVGDAFIENPQNYGDIHHRDKEHLNNNVNNLSWVTRKENLSDAICVALNVININTGQKYHFNSITEASEKLCLNYYQIYKVIDKNKEYCGFIFKRANKVSNNIKKELDHTAISKESRNPDYINSKECCEWLGISEDTLDKLRDDGVIPEFWLGRKLYFSKKAIDNVIHNKLMTSKKLRK